MRTHYTYYSCLFFILAIFFCDNVVAQQHGIGFRAYVYNHEGVAMSNKTVAIRFTLKHGGFNGKTIYENEQYVETDQYGAFSTIIGTPATMRTVQNNSDGETFYLCYETDINNDGIYKMQSIQQLIFKQGTPLQTSTSEESTSIINDENQTTKADDYGQLSANDAMGTQNNNLHDEQSFSIIAASHLRPIAIEGALAGEFSISKDHKVQFSKGNLQYRASSNTWRFAERQYLSLRNKNNNISPDYDGWIDLFGWGTSGWNSGAVAYLPTSTDSAATNYMPGGNANNDLTGAYANADWGIYNGIDNGGNRPGEWRTLSRDEWTYLLKQRQCNTVCGEKNARFAKSIVNEIEGVIILPDNYQHPSSISLLSSINLSTAAYKCNIFSLDEWQLLEQQGAVFLPKTYCRYADEVDNGKVLGDYWTSSHIDEKYAYYVYILEYTLDIKGNGNRNYGRAVRLVHDL